MNSGQYIDAPNIVIAGAGSIGCFVGGLLAASGHRVTFLARPRIIADIYANNLTLSDFSGLSTQGPADLLSLSDSPECLKEADIILVCVKTGATADMASLIARHAPQSALVISLQNGLEGCEALRDGLPGWDVRAAMVPFNVVPIGPGRYHRATSGDITLQAGPGGLGNLLTVSDLRVIETGDIVALQWGKLLMNLANALNALSGLTLQDQLTRRDWRRLMADQMAEALAVLKSAGIKATSTTPLPAWAVPHVLRLPTPLFTRIAARMLTIDPTARSSMSYDLTQTRLTEIDSLQGAIIKLGFDNGISTPICTHVAQAIRTAEANKLGTPGLSPTQLRP